MSEGREIRCYDYVNLPYERVRDILREGAAALFRDATQSAASRAGDVAAELRVNLAGIDVGTEIDIEVAGVEEHAATVTAPAVTRLELSWKAAQRPGLFPTMRGVLSAYRLSAKETQLDFSGTYDPPMGKLGDAIDSVVAHRLADASVHRFITDVAAHLRKKIG